MHICSSILWHANITVKESKTFQFSNTFVESIMKAYYELTCNDLKDAIKPELFRQPLWLYTDMYVQRKIILYKTMFERYFGRGRHHERYHYIKHISRIM